MEYTADDYRKAIIEILANVADMALLKRIYSLLVYTQRKKAGE